MTWNPPGKPLVARHLLCGVVGAAALIVPAAGAQAQDVESELQDLKRLVVEMQEREAKALQRVQELEARINRIEHGQISDSEAGVMRGRYTDSRARPVPADPMWQFFDDSPRLGYVQSDPANGADGAVTDGATEKDRKTPAPTEAVTELTEQRQGRFGDRIGLELGLGYTHFDNARINLTGFLALDAIFLGTLSIDQVTADIFTAEPTLRFGLSDRFFLNAEIPYLYRSSNFRSGGAGGDAQGLTEETVHHDGFGDLTAGASYRLFRERGGRPDIVISAQVKAPTGDHPFGVELREVPGSEGNLLVPERLSTGTGVWGASVGISALKTLDPMVVFGSVIYYRNFERNFGDIDEAMGDQPGRVDVGDALQIGAGLAFALNDRSSISMSYTQRLVERTRVRREGQDWQRIVGSQANVGLFNMGATFSLGRHLTLITTVGIGLTDDSPDMAVGVRIPYRF